MSLFCQSDLQNTELLESFKLLKQICFFSVTGHADGSVRFWDTSTNCMQALCRVRTQKLFEKNKSGKVEGGPATEDDPYAITGITLSPDCKNLLLTGQSAQVSNYVGNKSSSLIASLSKKLKIYPCRSK